MNATFTATTSADSTADLQIRLDAAAQRVVNLVSTLKFRDHQLLEARRNIRGLEKRAERQIDGAAQRAWSVARSDVPDAPPWGELPEDAKGLWRAIGAAVLGIETGHEPGR